MNKNIDIKKELSFMSFNKLTNQNIINLFTFKPYNFRKETIKQKEIEDNYLRIQRDLKYNFNKIIGPIQNHTNIVKVVNENNINENFDNVDGLITHLTNVALITKLADCQGILLYDKENKVIGNIHSGWKGTLNRIISSAIKLMIDTYNSNPSCIEAYITPSIMNCCFEVDEDVKDAFIKEFRDIDIMSCIKTGEIKDNKQKYLIDTIRINKLVMLNLGLKEKNIISSNICTKCNNRIFHSHRSDGISSGRNLALICIKS